MKKLVTASLAIALNTKPLPAQKPLPTQERYLSVKQVAEYLGIGVSTVWAWTSSDKIDFPPPVRIFGCRTTRWSLSSLNAFLENQEG